MKSIYFENLSIEGVTLISFILYVMMFGFLFIFVMSIEGVF
jgi:hypothetical protein